MNVDELYGTNLVAEDLVGREFQVTIVNFEVQEMKDGKKKGVIQFEGWPKGMVLNVTRKEDMKALYGNQTDAWIGKSIIIYCGTTSFQGKQTPSMAIKGVPTAPETVPVPSAPETIPAPVSTSPVPAVQPSVPPNTSIPGLDDEIPF